MTTFLIIIIILALVFDYINGFHDAANSIATIVSTKVLTPFQAVLWAAMFNFVAFFIFQDHAVANTIGKTVKEDFITLPVIFSGLLAAIAWNLLTWWYGIPSSSSHTLIGGFAGAAITHALMSKGLTPIENIIDSQKILQIVLFIFLAPIIGMVISMFIALVTITRNTWIRIGIMIVTGLFVWMLFDKLEDKKIKENLAKYFLVDKLKGQVEKDSLKDPAKIAAYERAKENYRKVAPMVHDFDKLGATKLAAQMATVVSFKDVELNTLNERLARYFKIKQLKNEAQAKPSMKAEYDTALAHYNLLKPLINTYHTSGPDTMLAAMAALYQIHPNDLADLKKEMKTNSLNDLRKEISRADNSYIVYGILIAILIFAISYIYTEKIREPNAYRQASMYKKLQLLSSAAFSIGHGGNDAQKVMGIIGAALFANGVIGDVKSIPNWVPFACYTAIGLGTLSGGWKIVKTMGTRITKVTPLEGVSAETAGAMTLFMTEQMGIPVSTTHTITGSIIGVGATKRLSAVRWGVTINLLWAWVLTIPVTAILAAITYLIYSLF